MRNPFQNLAYLSGRIFLQKILRILNDHISKTKNHKNREINFSFVSEHYATFLDQKMKTALFEEGGGVVCMSLTETGPQKNMNQNRNKTKFFVENFCRKKRKPEKLQIKILSNEKN